MGTEPRTGYHTCIQAFEKLPVVPQAFREREVTKLNFAEVILCFKAHPQTKSASDIRKSRRGSPSERLMRRREAGDNCTVRGSTKFSMFDPNTYFVKVCYFAPSYATDM